MAVKVSSGKLSLECLGLNAGWQIVPVSRGALCMKAAKELRSFLRENFALSLPVVGRGRAGKAGRIIIGTFSDLHAVGELLGSRLEGDLCLMKVPVEEDAYYLLQKGGDALVLGSNGRSIMFAVFHLEDWLRGDRDGATTLNVFEKAYFRERWMNPTIHGRCDVPANYDYLMRLGVNATYLRGRRDVYETATSQGLRMCVSARKHLPVLSRLQPVHRSSARMMNEAYRLARANGMETVLFTDEPKVLFPQRTTDAAILAELTPDMLGYPNHAGYRREGRLALSIFHPEVEQHYRELVRNVMRKYPDLRDLYVYNQDVDADNCWPPSDVAGRRQYPAGYAGYPYAAHARLVQVLQEEGRKFNKRLRVDTGTWHWFYEDKAIDEMVARLPPGSVLACLNTNDDRVAVVKPAGKIPGIIEQAKKRQDLVMIADDDFNGTSDDLLTTLTAGFPVPYRTYRKMRQWAEDGAVGITQHHTGGPSLGVNSINDLAWRHFSWTPQMQPEDAEKVIFKWLLGQLGDRSAALQMRKACLLIDQALDADEATPRPYSARLMHGIETITTPLKLDQMPVISRQAIANREYDNKAWHLSLAAEVGLLRQALAAAEKAVAAAPANRRPFFMLWKDDGMTCRDYARLQKETIEIVMRAKQSILHLAQFVTVQNTAERQRIMAAEKENTRLFVIAVKAHKCRDAEGCYDSLLKLLEAKLLRMQGKRMPPQEKTKTEILRQCKRVLSK